MRPPRLDGRGARSNPSGRYETHAHEAFDDGWGELDDDAPTTPRTTISRDTSRTIITTNNSPDLGFNRSINPYKGCEHGCIYCYARPTHAYLGLSPGLDFETKIFARPDGAKLLRAALARPRYTCETIVIGANTDPYQPAERRLGITRELLEVLEAHQHPVSLITKSNLVLRDADVLSRMARKNLASVVVSVTTLDRKLARRLEPRAATPTRRLDAIRGLTAAGVPVAVLAAPMIPALNDSELERIFEAVAEAGARTAGYVLIRLPLELKDLFNEWLERFYPDRAARVLELIRQTRGGKLYQSQFGVRMRGTGPYADLLAKRYRIAAARHGLDRPGPTLDCTRFRAPKTSTPQLSLFE